MAPSLEYNDGESRLKAIINGLQTAILDDPADSKANDIEDSESSDPEIVLPHSNFICEAKDFYPDEFGCWTQEYPSYLKAPAENDKTAEYAILKRNRKSTDPRKKLCLDSIVVQSPLLKKVLGTVFEDYEGICTDLDRLEFDAPFRPFVHRWERLRKAKTTVTDLETRDHLKLLWDILEKELRIVLATRDNLLSLGVMTHAYLWTMFEPKTLVFEKIGEKKTERVLQVQSYDYGYNSFNVASRFVEWAGEGFGMDDNNSSISSFQGTKKITDLSFFPLKYHPEATEVQKRCIARGRLWQTFSKYTFTHYTGSGFSVDYPYSKYNVDSRVIVDTGAFNLFNPDSCVSVYPLEDDSTYTEPLCDGPVPESGSLTPWQLLLCTHVLRGYSLKDKIWITMHLNNIKAITWNNEAFSRLVLPNDTKDLVLAFAQSQLQRQQTFDDVIKGKGQGVILLLSGPPGVGKTLTAEAVAETMKVPLYMMAAGDLGTSPNQVEESLKKILQMTTKWKAVLLLDEADVYLEARSTHDLERNKLVSIFLRNLEYYEGFLFLTSNRVDNIDAAFESRIHLSLMYGDLSFDSRRQVWYTFLAGPQSSKCAVFSDEQIDSLARIELNGRQIKNIIKTAQLLATSKSAPLNFEHVQSITKLRAANAFTAGRNHGGQEASGLCGCRCNNA